jgi:phosphoribosylaminoimidazolecarboxamide formyltransferase/IMP cyclohydrolase
VFELADYATRDDRDLAMAAWLRARGVRFVVCAGYMHLLTPAFLACFPGSVVNVHPSLLPAFPGTHAIEDALAAGARETGVTVHFVDDGVDSGPIVLQEAVAISGTDTPATLLERVHAVEHRLLPLAVRLLLAHELGSDSRVIERALLSVYDKTGLEPFVRGLVELGVELVASGGTAAFVRELGLPVRDVEEITAFPELMGGRVKTLHPRIHAGILARREREEDRVALADHAIPPIDLVCVSLYPFEEVAGRKDTREEQAVEMIDIGGPAMLRAAAKNFAHVVPVCSSEQYGFVLDELRREGGLSHGTRRQLAAEAFAHTAAYEAAIASWFADRDAFPEQIILSLRKVADLAYGENPHQRAAYYAEASARRHLLSRVTQVAGRELSFNNLNDLDAARRLVEEFALPACVIVKHATPCGCAVAATVAEAYDRALASDPVSAFGGVVVVNRPVERELAERLAAQFVEVLMAPGFTEDALEAVRRRESTRVLVNEERRRAIAGERDYRRVTGGALVQDADLEQDPREAMEVMAGSVPDERAWGDLLFAWRVAKHVASNAIVLARDLATIGIGAGQTSRVDAVRLALDKAGEHGHAPAGAVLASDAFFPFADGPELALRAGVTALIQPGGSKRDGEVVSAVQAAGATMVFTHRRHFRH